MKILDCVKVGKLLYDLRKEKNMTQKQVAELMNISDKTISKWERGLGCPDVSLLPELSQIFGVSIDGILSGELNQNPVVGGNMRRLKFFVCSQCGNIMTATGDATVSCCGKTLEALVPQKAEDGHLLSIEPVEDELYVTCLLYTSLAMGVNSIVQMGMAGVNFVFGGISDSYVFAINVL